MHKLSDLNAMFTLWLSNSFPQPGKWKVNWCRKLSLLFSLEERQRAEKKNREEKGHKFTPKWFDFTNEVAATPWGDLEVYQFNGKYAEHRAAVDSSSSSEEIDVKSTEFNPWQYEDLAAN